MMWKIEPGIKEFLNVYFSLPGDLAVDKGMTLSFLHSPIGSIHHARKLSSFGASGNLTLKVGT
jgi:hypothetical protein